MGNCDNRSGMRFKIIFKNTSNVGKLLKDPKYGQID